MRQQKLKFILVIFVLVLVIFCFNYDKRFKLDVKQSVFDKDLTKSVNLESEQHMDKPNSADEEMIQSELVRDPAPGSWQEEELGGEKPGVEQAGKEQPGYHEQPIPTKISKFEDFSRNTPTFQVLLRTVKITSYKNHADLFYQTQFHSAFKLLPRKEQNILIKEMFYQPWNTPKIIDGRPAARRYPDAIGIGSKKCGTSALQFFMKQHPQFKGSMIETHFYDNKFELGIGHYLKKMPYVHSDDIIFEKTPKYVALYDVPGRIFRTLGKNLREDLAEKTSDQEFSDLSEKLPKFILVTCDPVKRAYSDFVHSKSINEYGGVLRGKYESNFDKFIEDAVMQIDNSVQNAQFRFDPNESFQYHVKNIYNSKSPELSILTNGLYGVLIDEWLKYYTNEDILVLNGDDLMKNPFELAKSVETFLGMNDFFKQGMFRRSKSGYFCFYKNDDNGEEVENCMNMSDKGKTRSVSGESDLPEKARFRLKQFYDRYNPILFEKFGVKYDW